MICHDIKVLFIHIPKTAGQSIQSHLINVTGRHLPHTYVLGKNNDPSKGPPILDHLLWYEYLKYGYLTETQFKTYFKFSFVRNPWDRLVSEYKFRRYWLKYSFRDWVTKHLPTESWSDEYRHIMPQYKFICNDNMQLVVDYLGKFEELEKSFFEILQKLGINQNNSLPHINKSLAVKKNLYSNNLEILLANLKLFIRKLQSKEKFYRNYFDYYDRSLWSYVAQMYEKDIHYFDYSSFLDYFSHTK